MSLVPVSEIKAKLAAHADELARRYLPNGSYGDGRRIWTCSGIADTGKGSSMVVNLVGDRRGTWYDFGNCHADEKRGDMIDLIRLKEPQCCGEQREAIRWAKAYLGIQDSFDPKDRRAPDPAELARRAEEARILAMKREEEASRDREARARGARAQYLKGMPIAGTPVEAYLVGRGLQQPAGLGWPNALRYFGDVWNRERGTKEPAMLAPMYLADGTQTAVHRTWLQPCARLGWTKLAVEKPKKALGPSKGAFIPINKGSSGKSMAHMPEGEPIYVTEGIEDALVVRMMRPEARIVAAYSLDNMGRILFPPAARRLVLVCDRDDRRNETAQAALERSIALQQARGLDVQLVLPPAPHKDMNEWLAAWVAEAGGKAA